jgi:hypothetical protein
MMTRSTEPMKLWFQFSSYSHKWSDANKRWCPINSSPWFQTIENSSMPNLQKKISGIKDDIASDFDYEPTFQ